MLLFSKLYKIIPIRSSIHKYMYLQTTTNKRLHDHVYLIHNMYNAHYTYIVVYTPINDNNC